MRIQTPRRNGLSVIEVRDSMKTIPQREGGFTLVEILIVVATILLIVFVVLPILTRSSHRGHRHGMSCYNNLRQIGLGFRMYSNDHDDLFPFAVPTASGGTREFTNSPQVFLHFQALSNELVMPRILVCPMDSKRQRASDFLHTTNASSFQSNSNLSYFVSFDADESKPERLLSGDRNITGGVFTNGFMRLLKINSPAGWTKELHEEGGNIGLSDGSVSQTTAPQLQKQLRTNTLQTIRLAIP
jgi:competence protein ComGC